MKSSVHLALVSLLVFETTHADALDKWDKADRATVRLAPSVYPELPEAVSDDLEARGCAIPQTWIDREPHNVIKGHFRNSEKTDWAVLCSVNRRTVLLVYWGGTTEAVSEVTSSADKVWLQGVGDGKTGFSRSISAVDKKYIVNHANWYGGDLPSTIDHLGINEAFTGKASVIHYWYKGSWLKLRGAD